MNFINITPIVKNVLENQPETRDDDYLLWLIVIKKTCKACKLPDISQKMRICDFLEFVKYARFPKFETVSRVRRKMQEKYPELKGSAETQAARSEQERRFKEFARYGV